MSYVTSMWGFNDLYLSCFLTEEVINGERQKNLEKLVVVVVVSSKNLEAL